MLSLWNHGLFRKCTTQFHNTLGSSQWCCVSRPLRERSTSTNTWDSTWPQCCCTGPDPSVFHVLHTRASKRWRAFREHDLGHAGWYCCSSLLYPSWSFRLFLLSVHARDVKLSNQELWLSVLCRISVSSCPVLWDSRMRGMPKKVMWLLGAWPFLYISKCTLFSLPLLAKAGIWTTSEPLSSTISLIFVLLCPYVFTRPEVQGSPWQYVMLLLRSWVFWSSYKDLGPYVNECERRLCLGLLRPAGALYRCV